MADTEKILRRIKKIIPRKFFSFLQPAYHFTLAFLAALTYGFPSRHLKVIGVTGTKGKTTVVELLRVIAGESEIKVASLSSYGFTALGREEKNMRKMTMPGRFFVQKFLHEARKQKCSYVILEVTSEGIKQYRHRFINFHVAVMTNVAAEHLESHGSFEKYLRAKLDLFWRLPDEGLAIINRDDPNQGRFVAATGAKTVFYGKREIILQKDVLKFEDVQTDERGVSFHAGENVILSPLWGEFNFYNIAAAFATAMTLHWPRERAIEAIGKFSGVPGRMEFVQREPFVVVVDYAHTPDSLRAVYKTLRGPLQPTTYNLQPRLICVLGAAGGGRDSWKRPIFGGIAAEYCDEIILTNEDPYDENPASILEQIEAGFSKSEIRNLKSQKIMNRREAICEALQSAQVGDMVIITGKGSEPWMMGPNGTKEPWDDRGVVREELAKISVHPRRES